MAGFKTIVSAVLLCLAASVQPCHAKCGAMLRSINWDGYATTNSICQVILTPLTVALVSLRDALPPADVAFAFSACVRSSGRLLRVPCDCRASLRAAGRTRVVRLRRALTRSLLSHSTLCKCFSVNWYGASEGGRAARL